MKAFRPSLAACLFVLAGLSASVPALALPCACRLICSPFNCNQTCCLPDGSWTTCGQYAGCGAAVVQAPSTTPAPSRDEFLASLAKEAPRHVAVLDLVPVR